MERIEMPEKKTAVVLGGAGFIGSNLVNRLKDEGWYVISADLKLPKKQAMPDEFNQVDLTDFGNCMKAIPYGADRVYQLAADMGGAGYIFTGENDAAVMSNSAAINISVAKACIAKKVNQVFYASSACIYPEDIQLDPDNTGLKETDAYPANPDSEYGWEKLFSERLWFSFARNEGLDVRIARFHNIYGYLSDYSTIRAKAPAAISWKVLRAEDTVEIWGDGKQTRSFLFIDDCLDAIEALMTHPTEHGPINIGSEEIISINAFTEMIMAICGRDLQVKHIEGPQGVRGRTSDNTYVKEVLDWQPKYNLYSGMQKLCWWIIKDAEGIE